ncbi:mechanosensitive ion channel family protein [Roseovarius indicus]|uniref:Mechanosensitive ion channel protein n=1 Tax=Roseovarius indicus TaxID=540747 RepID=A0A0T5P6Y2_9RHOB|nr:mechanosensitive ion channel domain-containing protein [Roseovarius indicus]KRS16780.1 mechanosensitive ion channel protein [Roseovarius indicus]QEW24326.1 putative MscS family protein.1 precursor [Roseovarius indicus]SFD72483.1 Mechanosensitive ion channel [Roseovarius indicus]
MDEEINALEDAQKIALGVWEQLYTFGLNLLRPWNAYQVGIIVALAVVAHILARLFGPRLHNWMRTREGWPKWRMRFLVLIHRRLRLIFFVLLSWPAVWIMREMTWPSRSYLLAIVAQLALAWLIIAIVTRLIANGFVRSVVRYVGWTWVTLSILDLTDEAQSLLESAAIEIGEMRLSAWIVLQAIAVIILLMYGARFISGTTSARIRSNADISPSMQVLAIKLLQVVLYGAAFFIGLKAVGVDLTGLAVLSGAIGVGLGFGLQKVVSNLVSGVILLLDRSIKPGDVISLGETFGWINSLGARYVSITTRDGKEYLIPNEDLITGQVVNWSHSNDYVRLDIYFGTAYADDPHEVRRIAIEASQKVERVLSFKKPVCHIVGFGDSSVDYILRFWISDPTGGLTNIRGNVYLALWDAFKENGISIPFPQREVRLLEYNSDSA